LPSSERTTVRLKDLLKKFFPFTSFSKKPLKSLGKPLHNGVIVSHLLLQNEKARLKIFFKVFLKPFLLKLKRGKLEEVSPKIIFSLYYAIVRSLATKNLNGMSF
jgi:hypothetical protein